MTVVLPLHILATIILFGSLFLLCVVLQPSAPSMDKAIALSFWHRILSRFFVWGSLSMMLILITGIAIVFLKFGGPAGIPRIHRANMMIGIPAIALFWYLYLAPLYSAESESACRHAGSNPKPTAFTRYHRRT